MAKKVIIGARKSPLAQIQAQEAAVALGIEASFVGFTTSGDLIQDQHLRDLGGKELFVLEVEKALLSGEIDLAVHSLKDLPVKTSKGVVVGAVLPRENPSDGLVSAAGFKSLTDLPLGAKVGTASPRRQAQLRNLRPDVEPVLLRGNVGTRLKKVKAGGMDAALLAMAGLKRLGLEKEAVVLSPSVLLPAAGQGVIVIQCRADDRAALSLCQACNDPATQAIVAAERQFSNAFGASCHVPVAAYAEWVGDKIQLRVELLTPDGQKSFKTSLLSENPLDPIDLGERAAAEIKKTAGAEVLAQFGL